MKFSRNFLHEICTLLVDVGGVSSDYIYYKGVFCKIVVAILFVFLMTIFNY